MYSLLNFPTSEGLIYGILQKLIQQFTKTPLYYLFLATFIGETGFNLNVYF